MLAAQGRDVLLSEERIEGCRNFVNKIWNASKLSLAFAGEDRPVPAGNGSSFLPDRWIRSRAQRVIGDVHESILGYRFNEAANALYSFVWHEYCDWYLELIKPNLYGKVDRFDTGATRAAVYNTLEDILKLLHPIMPFVTEEIYQRLPGRESPSIMIAPFPAVDESQVDEESERMMETVMGIVDVIRNIRGETGIAPNVRIETVIRASGNEPFLREYEYYIRELGKVEKLTFTDGKGPDHSAVGVYRDIEVFVPLKDLIDVARELGRIEKELARIDEDGEKLMKKLGNEAFRQKAPAEVIARNEAQHSELMAKKEKLILSRKVLENLSR
jgi:valyl-tRNA synthetase